MINDSITISLIGVGGSLLTTYIAVRVRRKKPKGEYVDVAMERLEKIAKRQDIELQRVYSLNDEKDKKIREQADEISLLNARLSSTSKG